MSIQGLTLIFIYGKISIMRLLKTFYEVNKQSWPLVGLLALVIIFVSPMTGAELLSLTIAYILVMIGQTFFLTGVDNFVLPIGKLTGSNLYKLKKPFIMVLFGLMFGLISSIAEPELRIIAIELNIINPEISIGLTVFICAFGVGSGIALAMYKSIKNLSLKWLFVISYGIAMLACLCTPNQFVGVAFDASGATTGDLSTPFILALGAGIGRTISKKHKSDEQFGIVGLASVVPLLVYLVFGMIKGNASPEFLTLFKPEQSTYLTSIFSNLFDALLALSPVVITFLVYNFFFIKLSRKSLYKLLFYALFVYFGLAIFLTGVDVGFTDAGRHISSAFLNHSAEWLKWILPFLAFMLCFFITLCEPNISILTKQVEEMTNGLVEKKILRIFLAIGLGIAGFLCIFNILIGTDLRVFLIPLYVITVVLTIFAPNLFIGIAYDAGGATGGAITTSFLVPMCLAAAKHTGGENPLNVLVNGFGIIGYISVTPIILVLILGMIYNIKEKRALQERGYDDEL